MWYHKLQGREMTIKKSQFGFTLIEVLVSLMVVGLVMSQVASVTWANHRGTQLSGKRMQAYFLAQEQKAAVQTIYDENRWADFTGDSHITNLNGSDCLSWDSINSSWANGNCLTPLEGTTFTSAVKIVTGSPGGGTTDVSYRRIDITVIWGSSSGEKVELEYYLTQKWWE